MKFNTYNIIGDESYVVHFSLAGSTPTRVSTGLWLDDATSSCDQRPQQYWNATMDICLAHGQTLAKIYCGIETFVKDHPQCKCDVA